jgi:hypothetical protein
MISDYESKNDLNPPFSMNKEAAEVQEKIILFLSFYRFVFCLIGSETYEILVWIIYNQGTRFVASLQVYNYCPFYIE